MEKYKEITKEEAIQILESLKSDKVKIEIIDSDNNLE